MLNPINHALTHDAALRYRVEPYVVAADVYSEAPHVGRGGWTWYTGSAAWMYRAGLEWILGCRMQGATLLLDPCVPRAWTEFHVSLRYRGTRYEIAFENPAGVSRGLVTLQLDGAELAPRPAWCRWWMTVRHTTSAPSLVESNTTLRDCGRRHSQENPRMTTQTYPFSLPPLPYAPDALEPHFDARTMSIHHDEHHRVYVERLNAALKDHPGLHGRTIENLLRNLNRIPPDIRPAVRNNGGGHLNHSLFWSLIGRPASKPHGSAARRSDGKLRFARRLAVEIP